MSDSYLLRSYVLVIPAPFQIARASTTLEKTGSIVMMESFSEQSVSFPWALKLKKSYKRLRKQQIKGNSHELLRNFIKRSVKYGTFDSSLLVLCYLHVTCNCS